MHMRNHKKAFRATAFTLIELLVVITIIMLLVGILAPSVSKAIALSYNAKSAAAIQELQGGALGYFNDHKLYPGQAYGYGSLSGSQILSACVFGLNYTDSGSGIDELTGSPTSVYVDYKVDKVIDEVDFILSDRFPDVMAVLYYPSKVGNTGKNAGDAFTVACNSTVNGGKSLPTTASYIVNEAFGTPYNYDTFLLIGAGLDREYFLVNGSTDDVTNFRK